MRNAFAHEVTACAAKDTSIVVLSGDIGNRLFDFYKQECPGRFFNCGVAEANMTSMAAGLAMCGLRPITYTITPFNTIRCLEQIRVDICYHNLPVIIVGTGSGLSYANLGSTHHSCEDIALLRVLPNMTVICPADVVELRLALRAAVKHQGPVYLRIGKKNEPVIYANEPPFKIGKAIVVKKGHDVCLLSTGNMLPISVGAVDLLKEQGISAQVVSFHTVKPLDVDFLKNAFGKFPLILTIEEHSLIGGFGSAIAEWLVDNPSQNGKLGRIGLEDKFIHGSGNQENARKILGLTSKSIADKAIQLLSSD